MKKSAKKQEKDEEQEELENKEKGNTSSKLYESQSTSDEEGPVVTDECHAYQISTRRERGNRCVEVANKWCE